MFAQPKRSPHFHPGPLPLCWQMEDTKLVISALRTEDAFKLHKRSFRPGHLECKSKAAKGRSQHLISHHLRVNFILFPLPIITFLMKMSLLNLDVQSILILIVWHSHDKK